MSEYEQKPVQAKAKAPATAGPAQDDRYGAGKVGTNMSARIIGASVNGTATRITIAHGTTHGAHAGMEGYIKSAAGMLADFQLDEAREAISFANVEGITPDQLQGLPTVVINPTAKNVPRKTITAPESTHVIGVRAEGDKTEITIALGSTKGATVGMRGALQGNLGTALEAFTITEVSAMRSKALVHAPAAKVQDHRHVVLYPNASSSSAPVQRRANGAASSVDVQSTAQAGVAGANSRLPHFDAIQRSFGKHDISGVQAQVGGAATEASQALGAQAYATGNKVAFASAPDLHTAAHEAAHTIQQARGAVGFQGLGAADDEHERHADAVADAVVAGQSAEALLDGLGGTGSATAVQRKPDPNPADELVRGGMPSTRGRIGAKQGPGPIGDGYLDHGPACEGIEHEDCFLNKDQRLRLIDRTEGRIAQAGRNFQLALAQVSVATLLEKDEDLPFMVGLLLDMASAFVAGKIATSLSALKTAQEKALSKSLQDAIQFQLPDPPSTWASRLQHAVASVKDETIKGHTRTIVAGAKSAIVSAARGRSSAKKDKNEWLQQLQSSADSAYVALEESFAAGMSDGELITLWKSFALENHHISMYRAAIESKMKRFEESKVRKIGRQDEMAESGILIERDLYVVWLVYASGAPRRLAYRHQDTGAVVMQGARLGRDASENLPMKLEPRSQIVKKGASWRSGSIEIVPDEFVEAALIRHEQMWGLPPAIERVDDRVARPTPGPSPGHPASGAPSSPSTSSPKPVPVPKVFDVDPNTGKAFGS